MHFPFKHLDMRVRYMIQLHELARRNSREMCHSFAIRFVQQVNFHTSKNALELAGEIDLLQATTAYSDMNTERNPSGNWM